jgi:hypothetical protein
MNVQTTPAAIALAPLNSGQQDDRSLGTSKTDNAISIEAWNTVLFEKFCRFRHVMSLGLAGHSDELFRRSPFPQVRACSISVLALATRLGASRHR